MQLTDAKIRKITPAEKMLKLTDGDGLVLFVTPQGHKWWRFRYRFGGDEKMLSLGVYPAVSLADAREKRNDARKLLRQGVDPGALRKQQAAPPEAETFEAVAREWHDQYKSTWVAHYAERIMFRLERDVFPVIGQRPPREITSPILLGMLRQVQAVRTLEITHRIKMICGQVFRYAVATGKAERDITLDLRGAIPPVPVRHHAAPTDPKEIAPILQAIDGYVGSPIVRAALQLQALTFVRPGELRRAEWEEIDFDNAQWNIPAARMKMKIAHLVPLSRQATEILHALQPFTEHSRFVFPGHRSATRCMSDNALNAALRRMGFAHTDIVAHGFRAMARTVLDEVLNMRPDIIEHQLAHMVKDPLGRAYNRTSHLAARTSMMQTWADYLDGLRLPASTQ